MNKRMTINVAEEAPSPARLALAEAIASVAEAQEQHDRIAGAISYAERMLSDARSDSLRAAEAVEGAKVAMRDAITNAAMTGEPVPPDTALRDARLSEAEAQDRVMAAQEALTTISEPFDSWKNALRYRTEKMSFARARVLYEAIPTLLDRSIEARTAFAELGEILHFICKQHTAHSPEPEHRELDRRAGEIYGLAQLPAFKPFLGKSEIGSAAWREAFDALATDPNAPLPV